MGKELTVKKTLHLNAAIPDVWEALTNPEITKKYFFGCEAISNWQVGSPIIWKITVDGKELTPVKGVVTAIEQNALLKTTCFAAEFEDVPSKHTAVTYKFAPENGGTKLSIAQGEFENEETCKQHDASWDMVLGGLKAIVEDRIH